MKRIAIFPILLAAAMPTACGGGGSNGQPATTLSGTAATGAPFDGAAVSIIDKSGVEVGSGTTNADGSYAITLSAGAVAPFVVRAVRDDLTLVSVVPDASASTVNITPITNLIAARLSTSGDPAKLAQELQANPDLLSPVKVQGTVNEIVGMLQSLLDAVGASANPLTGAFAADGTGMDRALDSLSIVITPDTATSSHIEVAIKQAAGEGDAPLAVQFAAGSNATAVPSTVGTVDATKLIESGTTPLIADLMSRINACHKLPTADRVDSPNVVPAAAGTIKASACKSLFKNDDPTAYLNNGRLVGSSSVLNDWFSIFHDGGTNAVYDRAMYDFSRANGDLVISFRVTGADGAPVERALVATKATVDGKPELRITGNGYQYGGGVVAYQQMRTFVNKPEADYYSTGYAFFVPNNGQFAKVVVTSPKGNPLTLNPNAGSTLLSIGGSANSFLRLGRQFVNESAADPKDIDATLVFSSMRWTDAELAAIPQQSVWKFDYYLTGNGTTTPDATQHYRTRARALTIGELKLQSHATLSDEVITDIKAQTVSADVINMAGQAAIDVDWNVPTGALAPYNVTGFGRHYYSPPSFRSFDDSRNVKTTARAVVIPCANQGGADQHCAGGVYASGANLNSLHLRARDAFGRDFTHLYAFYRPVMP